MNIKFAAFLALSLTTPAQLRAEWKLSESFENKVLNSIAISSDSQKIPVGERGARFARLEVLCLPEFSSLWFLLLWPESMTSEKSIEVISRLGETGPSSTSTWKADEYDGGLQSYTLDSRTTEGRTLMNLLLSGKSATLSLRPLGFGREHDAIFDLRGLSEKLLEVTKACPNWGRPSRSQ